MKNSNWVLKMNLRITDNGKIVKIIFSFHHLNGLIKTCVIIVVKNMKQNEKN